MRTLKYATQAEQALLITLVKRVHKLLTLWTPTHALQIKRLDKLKADYVILRTHINQVNLDQEYPWNTLWQWSTENLGIECQELLVSLLLEPYGHLVDDLANNMSISDSRYLRIQGKMKLSELCRLIKKYYGWIFTIDWLKSDAQSRVWYTSEDKLEPRLGERISGRLDQFELPLAPGRDVAHLYHLINTLPDQYVADFLLAHSEYRHCIRRIQMLPDYPYAEIHDNTIASHMMPVDLLRAKLSFFGAQYFDPFSDRWLRISMYRGAPYPDNIATEDAETWGYPL